MMRSKDFCLGFAFINDQVLLIRKTHPEQQAGKFNGIGGRYEFIDGDDLLNTMVREFREETGIDTVPKQWINHGHIEGYNSLLFIAVYSIRLNKDQYFYRNNKLFDVKSNDPEVEIIHVLNEAAVRDLHQRGMLVENVFEVYEKLMNINKSGNTK